MEYQYICKKVVEVVQKVAEFVTSERENFSRSGDIEIKGHSNFVTYVDKESELKLVQKLSKLIPDSGFIAEEGTSNRKGEKYNWIIDPLDGTTNFIHGLPPYSISVALKEDNELVVGVVLEIAHNEIFYAWKDGPAYRNDQPIVVAEGSNHREALIATGFPYYTFQFKDQYMKVFDFMIENTRGVRRLGSAAIDLCYVACGRFNAFWEYGLHAWDVAAGALILKQAGGKLADFELGNNYLNGGQIIASSEEYFEEFSKIVSSYMSNR